MIALGKELQNRGHQVTVINLVDSQEKIIRSSLHFFPVGEKDFPIGSTQQHLNRLGGLTGIAAFEYMITLFLAWDRVYLNELADRLRHLGVDFLLIDQTQLAPCSVADFLDLPYVNISNALILNYEIGVPPVQTSWRYHPACWSKLRNLWGISA
ncbi:MAG: glycosyltransferase family 1 protein [Synechococcaceae cyanobacterium SM2_3_1]|nr:glycosyltransferase family 1 protein [Synechococcaceae cyanobacterium SM2_3_1]